MEFFERMPWRRSEHFEGGLVVGTQKDYVFSKSIVTLETEEKYARLFQYRGNKRRILGGEYWLRDDFTIWDVPFKNNDEFAVDLAQQLEGKEAIEILKISKSNGHNPEWDKIIDEIIERFG